MSMYTNGVIEVSIFTFDILFDIFYFNGYFIN